MNASPQSSGALCIVLLVTVTFFLNEILQALYRARPDFADWVVRNEGPFDITFRITRAFLWIGITWICCKALRLKDLFRKTGLSEFPTMTGLFFVGAAIGLALLDIMSLRHVQGHFVLPADFNAGGEVLWTIYCAYSIFITPFAEELTLRGFIYSQFRARYGVILSIIVVFAVQLYFHWGAIVGDYAALLNQVASVAFLCGLREFTKSTWNCVAFHSIYNAAVLRQWTVCVAIITLSFLAVKAVDFARNETKSSTS